MIKDLIEVKQLPVIEQQLKNVSTAIDERVKNATSLVCTEETVKTIKELRASLNKDFKEFEEQRKVVKDEVLKPYNDFENIYKECIADKFRNADLILKDRIEIVENELKAKKEQEIKDYFYQYCTEKNIDFLKYEQVKINVTLSASLKSLKEQVKQFIDKTVDDLKLIETQEHKTEILVEYKQSLNVSSAITTVVNRQKAIAKEMKKQDIKGNEVSDEKDIEQKIVKNNELDIENSDFVIVPQDSPNKKNPNEFNIFPTKQTINMEITVDDLELQKVKKFLEISNIDYLMLNSKGEII